MGINEGKNRNDTIDSWSEAAPYWTHGIMRAIQDIQKWDKENGY